MAIATERAGANSSVAKLAEGNHPMARITVRYLWLYWLCAAVLLDSTLGDSGLMCVEDRFLNKSCNEIKDKSTRFVRARFKSGKYALCDTSGHIGSFVIQRRSDDGTDFYRSWEEYKYGFGDLYGSFWIGNELIHRLTNQYRMELRIDMTYKGVPYYLIYGHFRLGSEEENYRIQLSDFISGDVPREELDFHNNMAFTTYDRDNDKIQNNCAKLYKGGWWYDNCHEVNLNGQFGSRKYGEGVIFVSLTGNYDSLDNVLMKITQH